MYFSDSIVSGRHKDDCDLGAQARNILIWITGEAKLETIRLAGGRSFNKHQDLTHTADLNVLMDDVVVLVVEDVFPRPQS